MRVSQVVTGPLAAAEGSGFFGFGVGAANSGAQVLAPRDWTPPLYGEGEWERIVTELGLAGLVAIAASRFLVVWGLWRAKRLGRVCIS